MKRRSGTMARRRREVPTPELRCPSCRAELERYWAYCPNCSRTLQWRDAGNVTGAECYSCGWMVSDKASYCPWCGVDIFEADRVFHRDHRVAVGGFAIDETFFEAAAEE